MAENKKSFILYSDLIHTLKKMPSDKRGDLFLHILQYVNDENPITTDLIVELTFEPIKQQLKRDLGKWDNYIEKQKLNGAKGGRPKNPTESEKTQAFLKEPKKADSVNVNDSVSDNDNVKKKDRDAVKTATLKRVLDFKNSLFPYCLPNGNYTIEMVKDFFNYWSELNKTETKMKCELQTTFQIPNRLATWAKNEKPKFGEQPKNNVYKTTD